MNTRKFTADVAASVRMCLEMKLPIKVIAKIFDMSTATIDKYMKPTKAELDEAGPKPNSNELRLELFKLFAWSVASPIEMSVSFLIKESEVKSMKAAIRDYLSIDRYISYCAGVIDEVMRNQKHTFDPQILPHERKLLEAIIGRHVSSYERETVPGKSVFYACLRLMHKEPETYMPQAELMAKPSKALDAALNKVLASERPKTGLFIPKSVVDTKLAPALLALSESDLAVIETKFEFPEHKSTAFAVNNIMNVSPQRRQQILQKAIRNLSRRVLQVASGERQFDNYLSLDKSTLVEMALAFEKLYLLHLQQKTESEEVIDVLKRQLEAAKSIIPSDVMSKIEASLPNQDLLTWSIKELDLSVRAINCLIAANIKYLWQLIIHPREELLKYRNFGKKSLGELDTFLESKKLTFRTQFSDQQIIQLLGATNVLSDESKEKWIRIKDYYKKP